MFDRRTFLTGAAGAIVLLAAPHVAVAQAATDRRFVFIIQRGAADGLGTLAPTADPAFAALRGAFAEDFAGGARLGDFTLHPNLAGAATLYQAREALFVHAVASPYRDRSHFDGQNVLETGATGAYRLKDGWMNRLLGLLPQGEAKAIAVSATVPVALRGPHEVSSYAPSALPNASDDFVHRIGRTGRAGASGVATTFVMPQERSDARKMERELKVKFDWREADKNLEKEERNKPLDLTSAPAGGLLALETRSWKSGDSAAQAPEGATPYRGNGNGRSRSGGGGFGGGRSGGRGKFGGNRPGSSRSGPARRAQ